MNLRLGPDEGLTHGGGILYTLCGQGYGDHWLGNRTILDNDWSPGNGREGFRILAAGVDDSQDFHDCYLSFTWNA